MKHISIVLLLLLLCHTHSLHAQARRHLKKGNDAYAKGDYKTATAAYEAGIKEDTSAYAGLFNLGNALYQQKNYEQARASMQRAAQHTKEKMGFANAHYNMGNTYMEEKKWAEAIAHYKNALRKNPQDEDAKYNLSYAQKMLKKENGGGGKDKNKDDNKDKNEKDKQKEEQDKKEKQNQEEQKDKQQQPQKPDDTKDDQQNKPQPAPSKLTKQQADQMLDALQQEEKKVQDKMKKGKAIATPNTKDW